MLWQFQVNSKGTQPYIYMYPLSPKLLSHSGCHITLSGVPCSRSFLVIHFKYGSVRSHYFHFLLLKKKRLGIKLHIGFFLHRTLFSLWCLIFIGLDYLEKEVSAPGCGKMVLWYNINCKYPKHLKASVYLLTMEMNCTDKFH